METININLDLAIMSSKDARRLVNRLFEKMSGYDKEEFINDNIAYASDDKIDEAYECNHYELLDDDDDEARIEPANLEDPQRCYLLADTLSAYSRSRLRPTLPEAVEATKQMYQLMNWK